MYFDTNIFLDFFVCKFVDENVECAENPAVDNSENGNKKYELHKKWLKKRKKCRKRPQKALKYV